MRWSPHTSLTCSATIARSWSCASAHDRLAGRRHGAEQRAEEQAVQPRAVDVAVLEPVEDRPVHEPHPAADGGTQRRRRAARGEAGEDAVGRLDAHALDELAHLGDGADVRYQLRVCPRVTLDPAEVGLETRGQLLDRREL